MLIDESGKTINEPENLADNLKSNRNTPALIFDVGAEEKELLEGDSFNCGALMAETLIAAGWAESVPLE